jgi:hypothetical protein
MNTKTITPLLTISLFFSFTEVVVGYVAKSSITGLIQFLLAIFVIIFPFFVATCFFIILWCRPNHFYSPSEYQSDTTYYRVWEEEHRINPTTDKIEEDIKEKTADFLTSEPFIKKIREIVTTNNKDETLKGLLNDEANNLSKDIIDSNFFRIIVEDTPSLKITYSVKSFKDFSQFLDTVYFWLRDNSIHVRPYYYGEDWILVDSKTQKTLSDSRMLNGGECGYRIEDSRSLAQAGISAGMTISLKVFK